MNGNSLNVDMTIKILRCRLHKKFDTTQKAATINVMVEKIR